MIHFYKTLENRNESVMKRKQINGYWEMEGRDR